MKVILLEDIARVGSKFEVKNVPDGHALNYLIPKNMAKPATAQNLKELEKRAAKIEASHAADEEQFSNILKALQDKPVTIQAEANEKGHLFKGLHEDDVAQALEAAINTPVSAQMVVVEKPIKEVGEHTVLLAFGTERKEPLSVTVEAST